MDQKKVTKGHPGCLLVGCMLTVLDEAPSDEERQLSPDGCIDLLKACYDRF
jgi:hypothetical protein